MPIICVLFPLPVVCCLARPRGKVAHICWTSFGGRAERRNVSSVEELSASVWWLMLIVYWGLLYLPLHQTAADHDQESALVPRQFLEKKTIIKYDWLHSFTQPYTSSPCGKYFRTTLTIRKLKNWPTNLSVRPSYDPIMSLRNVKKIELQNHCQSSNECFYFPIS